MILSVRVLRLAVNAVVSASLRALPRAMLRPISKLPFQSSRMPGCSRRSKLCCSPASRTAATAARGAVLGPPPAAICNWSPAVAILPLTVSPEGSTTLSSASLRMLFTADQGMVTSPRNSLLMVSLPPSFFTMAPVMVSPLVSTTWSAARAAKESIKRGVKYRESRLIMAKPSCISGTVLAAFVGVQVALLVLLPAATPAGFVAAQFGLGAFECFVLYHVEAICADFVDGGLLCLHPSDLLPRGFYFRAEVFQLLARLARELRAEPCLDGNGRLGVRAMHDKRAGQHADDHQVAFVLFEFAEVVGQAEQDLGASRNLGHQAELLGERGEIERFGADGKPADDVEGLGRPLASNPPEGPARRPADGLILQRDEPGEGVQRGGVADLTQQGERADHQAVVVVQQIFAVSVEDAQQQRSAIGATGQHAIDQRGIDGLQAGHEELVEQAGRLRHVGARQPRPGLGIEVQLLDAKCEIGDGERPVGEDAPQQRVSFMRDRVGLDEAVGQLGGPCGVAVFFGV